MTTLKPADLKFAESPADHGRVRAGGHSLCPSRPASTILALLQVLAGEQAPVATTTTTAAGATTTTRRPRRRLRRSTTTTAAAGHDDDETFVHDDDQVMKAVVLVGGEGTRLRPLTLSAPKQMLPIVGVPMIERVLGHLASHGIDEAVLSLGYLPDAFIEAYPDGRVAGIGLTYAVEPEPLDTAGAVRFAATFAGIDETFVVVNGDVLTDLDLTALVAFHRAARRRGDDRPAPGGRPLRVRRGAHRRRRPGHGLRREAAPRRGADQRDQRRHLRARAVRARPDPRGRPGVDRAGDLSRHGARRRAVRPLRRPLLARHGDPGRVPRSELRLPEPASAARS